MLGVPAGLARERLDDVGVDLGQRVVSTDRAERVRQGRVATGVVQGVAGLVQERAVVVEPALGTRDQVDDARRIRGDDARARRLLRPVVEIELDALLVLDREPDRMKSCCAHRNTPLLRVRVREWRESPQPTDVSERRLDIPLGSEQLVEPALAKRFPGCGRRTARLGDGGVDRAMRDVLRSVDPRDGVRLARELGVEIRARREQSEPSLVEAGRHLRLECTELLTVRVCRQYRKLRLGRAERDLLAAPVHPRGQ